MRSCGKKIGAIAFASAFLGYQLFIHKITISGQITSITACLVLIPSVVVAGWAIALELGMRLAILLTAALMLAALVAANIFGLPHPAVVFGLPHMAVNLFLLWFFAHTLKEGREPLITSIARRVAGPLTPDLEIYTRRVTLAWSLFFFLQMVISVGMYTFASVEAWSTFINILNAPLIVIMFLSEFVYRVLRYRDPVHRSFFAGLQIFSRDTPPSSRPIKAR